MLFQCPCVQDITSNHHLGQSVQAGYSSETGLRFCRSLHQDAVRRRYYRRNNEDKTVLHRGQLKLLCAEIEFLTNFASKGDIVLYVGAAPGRHIHYLTKLFPELSYILYDPAPFSKELLSNRVCTLHSTCFTEENARTYASTGNKILFISDIRTGDFLEDSDRVVEQHVIANMTKQREWYEIIQPKKALLKFRLPWREGSTEYLNGDIMLPVFGGVTTTETRLVPSTGTSNYDHIQYQDQLFFFNTHVRIARYEHPMEVDKQKLGLDHCYDCTAFLEVVKSYVLKYAQPDADVGIAAQAQKIVQYCMIACYGDCKTLFKSNFDPGDRVENIRKRQWIENRPAYENRAHLKTKRTKK